MIVQKNISSGSSRRIRWSSTTMTMGVLLLLLLLVVVSMTIASHSIIAADAADAADTADTDPGTTAATTTTTATTSVALRHVVTSTIIQKFVRPYLPPPIIRLLKATDECVINSRLQEPEDEPTIILLLTLVAAYLIYKILASIVTASLFGSSDSSSSSATTSRSNRTKKTRKQQQRPYYDRTVILVGPSLGGKTSIFNYLVQHKQQTQRQTQKYKQQDFTTTVNTNTVRSLQSTTAYVNTKNIINISNSSLTVKVIDTPGVWKPSQQIHVDDGDGIGGNGSGGDILYLVVLDSTKALSKEAVDVVYELFTTNTDKETTTRSKKNNSITTKTNVMIVCHKSHAAHAKNPRRIKLQLRNELQKLSKLRGDNSSDSNSNSFWENVVDNQVVFGSSDCTATTNGSGSGKKEKSDDCDNMDYVDMDAVVEFISSSSSS